MLANLVFFHGLEILFWLALLPILTTAHALSRPPIRRAKPTTPTTAPLSQTWKPPTGPMLSPPCYLTAETVRHTANYRRELTHARIAILAHAKRSH